MTVGLFVFHRDLRVQDNTALLRLFEQVDQVIPIFVFSPHQVNRRVNHFYNSHAIQFMCDALRELDDDTHQNLCCFYGDETRMVSRLLDQYPITHVGFNLDYTRYARERTHRLRTLCESKHVQLVLAEDYTLTELDAVRDGEPYVVFKPYHQAVLRMSIPRPRTVRISAKRWKALPHGTHHRISLSKISTFYTPNPAVIAGGRHMGKLILSQVGRRFRRYAQTRNTPSIETTHLSAHIKFGTVSIREVYHVFRKTSADLVRQLIWHDFYAQLMYFLPHARTLGKSNFQERRVAWRSIRSGKGKMWFQKWCDGETGFPIIDAGMRQLNQTGWMHNRVRLLTSNFLALLLGIDWRHGERYFAQRLVDYDPSSNNGNWQFTAQVGTDRSPYLRIYNPFAQSEKIDKDAMYIHRWVPELREVQPAKIHRWMETEIDENVDYPAPMCDYATQREEAQQRYK